MEFFTCTYWKNIVKYGPPAISDKEMHFFRLQVTERTLVRVVDHIKGRCERVKKKATPCLFECVAIVAQMFAPMHDLGLLYRHICWLDYVSP